MQVIVVKYVGPTNHRGSHFRATVKGASVTMAYDHGLDAHGNHLACAKLLQKKMGWEKYKLKGGILPDGHSMAFVQS